MKLTEKSRLRKDRVYAAGILKAGLLSLIAVLGSLLLFSQVTIEGRVKNTIDSVIAFQKNGAHPIRRGEDSKRFKAKINRDGSFQITLPEEEISEWMIQFGDDGFQTFDLVKGQALTLEADYSHPFPLKAVGPFADDFNYTRYYQEALHKKYYSDTGYHKRLRTASVDSTFHLRKAESDYATHLLEEYQKNQTLSSPYYQWLKAKYQYFPYRSFSFGRLATGDKKLIFDRLEKLSFGDDYAALHSYDYAHLVDEYLHYKFNGGVYPMGVKAYLDYVWKSKGLSSLTRQSVLARNLFQLTQTPKWDTLYSKYLRFITNRTLLSYITKERSRYLAVLKSIKKPVPIDPRLSLSQIFSKYKGKVLYVDLWASWCGPCRGEMPNAKELQQKLAGKDVIFLYLGYQDREESWLVARKDLQIEGEHYLLTPKQIKEAGDLFEVNGIPHYVIIDKKGRVLSKNAERPSDVYETLLKLL